MITVLEGESLMNDATALVLYRTAIDAAVTGTFSWGESVVRFFIDAGVGALVGLLVAWLIDPSSSPHQGCTRRNAAHAGRAVRRVDRRRIAARLRGARVRRRRCVSPAAALDRGGPASRLQIRTVWDLVVFLLNAMIFLLLGAQFGVLLASCAAVGSASCLLARCDHHARGDRRARSSGCRSSTLVPQLSRIVRPRGERKAALEVRSCARLMDEHARRRLAGDRARAATGARGRRVRFPIAPSSSSSRCA